MDGCGAVIRRPRSGEGPTHTQNWNGGLTGLPLGDKNVSERFPNELGRHHGAADILEHRVEVQQRKTRGQLLVPVERAGFVVLVV